MGITASSTMPSMFRSLMATIIVFTTLTIESVHSNTPCQAQYLGMQSTPFYGGQQTTHFVSTTTVYYDPLYTIQCCGVIYSWDVMRSEATDSCPTVASCTADFSIWRNVVAATTPPTADFVGANLNYPISAADATGYNSIVIPASDMIPVQPGDVIGWSSAYNPIDVYADPMDGNGYCTPSPSLTCTTFYLEALPNLGTLTANSTYHFSSSGQNSGYLRYAPIRAILYPGTTPIFKNLPASVTILSTSAVGSFVYNVSIKNPESKETITTVITSSFPTGNYFTINSTTGTIEVASALTGGPWMVALNIQTDDGCLTNTSTLEIFVQEVSTTTVTTTVSFFQTTDGIVTITMLSFAVLGALAGAIGIIVLCSKLLKTPSKLSPSSGEATPAPKKEAPSKSNNLNNKPTEQPGKSPEKAPSDTHPREYSPTPPKETNQDRRIDNPRRPESRNNESNPPRDRNEAPPQNSNQPTQDNNNNNPAPQQNPYPNQSQYNNPNPPPPQPNSYQPTYQPQPSYAPPPQQQQPTNFNPYQQAPPTLPNSTAVNHHPTSVSPSNIRLTPVEQSNPGQYQSPPYSSRSGPASSSPVRGRPRDTLFW